jgi:photosystem II stability/assembly factor-like uncharacterized protein
MATVWNSLPPVDVSAPVLALTTSNHEVWAAGPGGICCYSADNAWHPRLSGLPLTAVAALIYAGGWLIAGGAEGIARSSDGGRTWQPAEAAGVIRDVTALVASPRFTEDTTLLAATLNDGIMRSEDAGRTWKVATFGLQAFDVTMLAWGTSDSVLAATADGIYQSPNAGRAWRLVYDAEGIACVALAFLPDGAALAARETGGLLRAADGERSWELWGDLPAATQAIALHTTSAGLVLLSTTDRVLCSRDGGQSFTPMLEEPVFAFAEQAGAVYAGTASGTVGHWLKDSEADLSCWHTIGCPPLHDLRRMLLLEGQPLVAGIRSTPALFHNGAWHYLHNAPLPLVAIAVGPGAALWASSPDGLFRSDDAGLTWTLVLDGDTGYVSQITFRLDNQGWAGSADGRRFLYTSDAGATWTTYDSPFGILPLVALQATSDLVIAGTYDSRRKTAQLWRSSDNGRTWERGAEIATPWPVIAMSDTPPTVTLGSLLFHQDTTGQWKRLLLDLYGGMVRRVFGINETILALTTTGLLRSNDNGHTWTHDDGLPTDQVMDIAADEDACYVLLSGGRIWSRTMQP